MTEAPKKRDEIRKQIIKDPAAILDDRDVMKALIAANEKTMGNNIVDLRGIAMERLEDRLDRLEDTHRNVIAAAYDNLSGTGQIQRAVLALLETTDFDGFLTCLTKDVAEILKIERIRLCLEGSEASVGTGVPSTGTASETVGFYPVGTINKYIVGNRKSASREVTLRQVSPASAEIYGDAASWIQSEALLKLDLGKGNRPGLLVLGSEDPHLFRSNQGTDLLAFFGGVFERLMRRWLS